MRRARLLAGGLLAVALAAVAVPPARGASSTPIALDPGGSTVWAANPDSNTVARFDVATLTRTAEVAVGRYPRTVAVTADHVFVTNQLDDTITRLDSDGSNPTSVSLGFGCAPYAVVVSGTSVLVTCEGPSTVVVLDTALAVQKTIPLAWPEARAIAVAADGTAYVTHYLTKEPNHTGHVSVVDPAAGTVPRVLAIAPDFATCETVGGGQGVANLLSAVAVVPAGPNAGQLWVGGTLHNSLRKGLFERSTYFQGQHGTGLFPDFDFHSNPAGEGTPAHRNIYKPAFHDIARAGVWKLDPTSGASLGKLAVVGGATVSSIAFSADGTIAYTADLMANAFYAFRTDRGSGANPSALFGPVSQHGPGGVMPGGACTGNAQDVTPEDPYVLAPQARLVATGGMEALDATALTPVNTGVEWTIGTGAMRGVPDGVGTTPIGLALSADGSAAFVENYLARNVTVVTATAAGFRCQGTPATACATRADCPAHAECMPVVRAVIPSTASDPLPPSLLDGKILFSTSARDAAGANSPIPPFNKLARDGSTLQGEVTSTARDGASLACTSCHGDFGGTDGRTWDFSQFGSSLRNTMDLRGRASFAPGKCKANTAQSCTTDSECGDADACVACVAADCADTSRSPTVPPNITDPVNRARYFNPMGSTHWNGDRDEVEDFEFTYRELLGASDCDGREDDPQVCVGGVLVRSFVADPVELRADLSPEPNRHSTGRSGRLDHLGDYVYSLTQFVRNPNLGSDGNTPSAAAERGRLLFNDPSVKCSSCHNGPPGHQQFTDKGPNPGYDPGSPPTADLNDPFIRHDVGTTSVFDETDPFDIADDAHHLLGFTLFQNEQNEIPGTRNRLNAYLTPVLNDVWNTAPYLHDGSAPTLLDVVRSCLSKTDDCTLRGSGRNIDGHHGNTSFLSAEQMNDLTAFEKAPHGAINELASVSAVDLQLARLKIRFGKKVGTDTLTLVGHANLSGSQTPDPAHESVTVSVGIPAGDTMAIVERTLPPGTFKANRAGTSWRFADRRGTVAAGLRALTIVRKGGALTFHATGHGMDLAILKAAAPDYTVALEVGNDTMALTHLFKSNRKGTLVTGP